MSKEAARENKKDPGAIRAFGRVDEQGSKIIVKNRFMPP